MTVFFADETMVIKDCNFFNNTVSTPDAFGVGGGLILAISDCRVANCQFIGNSANGAPDIGSLGGAIQIQPGSNPQFVNCLVAGNTADVGSGINNIGGTPKYIHCTITGNSSEKGGAVFHSDTSSEPLLINCILWNNGQQPIIVDEGDSVTTLNFCDIQGGWKGAGSNNIDADPMFVDPGSGDYRLMAGSPCIDAADNTAVPLDINTDLDGNPRFIEDPDTKDTGLGVCPIVDMGSYEFQEGLAECAVCPWDLDNSGSVGTSDLLELFAQWGTPGTADFDDDGTVGTSDLLILFANWGPCG